MLTTNDWQRQLNTGCLLQHVVVEERQVPTVVSELLTESPLPLRLLDDFSLFTTEAVDGAEQPRRLDELQDGASICQALFSKLCELSSGAALLCSSSEARLRALLGLQSCPFESRSHQHWSPCFLAIAGLVEGLHLQARGMLLDQSIATASLAEAREAAHARVNISAVQDWVLDYSEPPAIWLVTSHAWYRCLHHPPIRGCRKHDSASDNRHHVCLALCAPAHRSCDEHKSKVLCLQVAEPCSWIRAALHAGGAQAAARQSLCSQLASGQARLLCGGCRRRCGRQPGGWREKVFCQRKHTSL